MYTSKPVLPVTRIDQYLQLNCFISYYYSFSLSVLCCISVGLYAVTPIYIKTRSLKKTLTVMSVSPTTTDRSVLFSPVDVETLQQQILWLPDLKCTEYVGWVTKLPNQTDRPWHFHMFAHTKVPHIRLRYPEFVGSKITMCGLGFIVKSLYSCGRPLRWQAATIFCRFCWWWPSSFPQCI